MTLRMLECPGAWRPRTCPGAALALALCGRADRQLLCDLVYLFVAPAIDPVQGRVVGDGRDRVPCLVQGGRIIGRARERREKPRQGLRNDAQGCDDDLSYRHHRVTPRRRSTDVASSKAMAKAEAAIHASS